MLSVMLTRKQPASEITEPLMLQSRFRRALFWPLVNNNGQNRRKANRKTNQKQTEGQLLKRDYMEALLTDMKSKTESI